ncbi:SdiA-regulated domain-containing protein [Rasiella sp. SM2506]|uniref:SdiA-regulated domain-containing protein n=1 Tax=Rasiella sp. SM2506 TaxID=3423914 RepID=UPI003D79ECC3
MKTLKILSVGTLAILVVFAVYAFTIQKDEFSTSTVSKEYAIEKTWELPKDLNEISGIAWLPDGTIASVQDEDGIIYIFDLKKNKIVEEIEFAGSGDYEGIAVHYNTAYVMRSDGTIYEISNFRTKEKSVETFETDFSAKNNMETITLHSKNNSLVIAPKDRDTSDDFKGLYQIPIDSKTMNATPSVRINMNDGAFKSFKKKKAYKTFSPSDVAIHPKTGEYYVLEGKNPKLLILEADGTIKKVHELDKKRFAQPEGITFSPEGILYISNESGDGPASIVQVKFK